jgi:hypothetical protein
VWPSIVNILGTDFQKFSQDEACMPAAAGKGGSKKILNIPIYSVTLYSKYTRHWLFLNFSQLRRAVEELWRAQKWIASKHRWPSCCQKRPSTETKETY